MSIKIYSNSVIYIFLHTEKATGGSELIHQLCHNLRKFFNLDAVLYFPYNHKNPIHEFYKMYNNPIVKKINDHNKNLLIFPEAYWIFPVLKKFNKIRKVMWWLSVDNFYLSSILSSKRNFFFRRVINKVSNRILSKPFFNLNEIALKKINQLNLSQFEQVKQADFHLAQSYYAMHHLENNGIPKNKIFYLSDYLNEDFLNIKTDLLKKKNFVAYNPKKGFSFTKKIIKSAPDIKFVPLINMTRQQVIETLQKAKVYIDFGNHPGKDRIPRESAILGCCVITGKRGSAKYFEDVPIPEKYKFDDKEENIPKIINKIKDCFENFKKRNEDFNYYRKVIKNEPKKFLDDLNKIFVRDGEKY